MLESSTAFDVIAWREFGEVRLDEVKVDRDHF
jgi:hypothetical protein